jgi:hypothetical protein
VSRKLPDIVADYWPLAFTGGLWLGTCAVAGPLVAIGVVAGLVVAGGRIASFIGRKMFGAGGQK